MIKGVLDKKAAESITRSNVPAVKQEKELSNVHYDTSLVYATDPNGEGGRFFLYNEVPTGWYMRYGYGVPERPQE